MFILNSVNIAIFKDRMEIRNPGGLVDGLTIDQINRDMISKRRNEIIAQLFHRVHFVEQWGRGIDLILSQEPDTDFKIVADIFVTTFKRKNYEEPLIIKQPHLTYGTRMKTPDISNKKPSEQIIILLRDDPSRSIIELSEFIGLSSSGVKYHLHKLKKAGTLKRVGSQRGGHWEITDSEEI